MLSGPNPPDFFHVELERFDELSHIFLHLLRNNSTDLTVLELILLLAAKIISFSISHPQEAIGIQSKCGNIVPAECTCLCSDTFAYGKSRAGFHWADGSNKVLNLVRNTNFMQLRSWLAARVLLQQACQTLSGYVCVLVLITLWGQNLFCFSNVLLCDGNKNQAAGLYRMLQTHQQWCSSHISTRWVISRAVLNTMFVALKLRWLLTANIQGFGCFAAF